MEKFKFKIEGTEIDDLLRITRGEEKEEKKQIKGIKCSVCGGNIEKSLFKKDDFHYNDINFIQQETKSYSALCNNCGNYKQVHKNELEEDNE